MIATRAMVARWGVAVVLMWGAAVGCATVRSPMAYVAGLDSDSLAIVDTATDRVVARIADVPQPWDIVVSSDGRTIYVGGKGRTVSAVGSDSHTIIDRIAAGKVPQAVDVSADGRALFVANAMDHTLSVISTSSRALLAQPRVGALPVAVAAIKNRPAVLVVYEPRS